MKFKDIIGLMAYTFLFFIRKIVRGILNILEQCSPQISKN